MQNVGASVGIIIDNKDEEPERVVMSDDGTGGGIQIPSMIISQTDGKKILNFIMHASPEEMSSLAIMASFDMNHPDNRVEYDIWFTSSNDKALDFISGFGQTDKELGN